MNVKSVREALRDVLAREGLERIPAVMQPEFWGWPEMEVSQYFAPHVLRKGFGIQILGGVGVHVKEFEADWARRLKKHYPSKKTGNSFLFGRHLSNFKEFTSASVIDQRSDVESEVNTILRLLTELPDDIHTLISDLTRGVVGPYESNRFLGHRVKWLAFLKWLKENSYKYPPALDELRQGWDIDPYETIFRELTE